MKSLLRRLWKVRPETIFLNNFAPLQPSYFEVLSDLLLYDESKNAKQNHFFNVV